MLVNRRSRFAQASLLCIGLASTLPFLQPFHTAPIPTFYSEWIAVLLGLTGLSLVLLYSPRSAIVIPVSAFHVVAVIGLVIAHSFIAPASYSSSTFIWSLFLATGAAVIIVASALKSHYEEQELLRSLAWCTLLAGTIAALTQYTLLVLDSSWYSHGLLGQRNHLASYLTLSIIALSYLYAKARLTARSTVPFAILLICAASLTSSRSILLYLSALVALCIYYRYRNRDLFTARLLAYNSSVLAGFVVAQYLQPAALSLLGIDTAVTTALERIYTGDGVQLRLAEWQKAFNIFLGKPWIGAGIDQFAWHSYVLHERLSSGPLPETFTHAHNIFLQLLAETGMAGLGVISLLIGTWAYSFFQRERSPETWYIGAVLLVLFIHSNLEHPLWYAYFLVILAFLLGIGDSRLVTVRVSSPYFLRLLGTLLLPVLMIYSVSTLDAYAQMEKMVTGKAYSRQQELYPLYTILLRQIAKNPALSPSADFIIGTMISLDRNDLDSKLKLNTRITRWRPVAQNVYRQSILLALAGRDVESAAHFTRALDAFPGERDDIIDLLTYLGDSATQSLLTEAKRRRMSTTPLDGLR